MRALIIDDEPMPAKHLREMIKQHCFEISEVELELSPKIAIQLVEENLYDIIFLDVEMPEMDGITFLKQVQLPSSTSVIFTTAYSEYALDAFKANATHYIMKPVEKEELVLAVRKAMHKSKKKEKSSATTNLTVFDGDEYLIVNTQDIISLEADGSYTKFTLMNKKILASKRIGFYEDKLPSELFLRCHNSYVVNLNQIGKLGKNKSNYLVMKNGDTVPISTTKKASIQKILGI